MVKKLLFRFCEMLVIFLVFAVLAGGITLYRLHKAPLNVNFALETIERALVNEEQGISTDVVQASLYWPELAGPILILLDQVTVLQDGQSQFSLERAAVSIDRTRMFVGQVRPQAIILEGTSLRLVRDDVHSIKVAIEMKENSSPQEEQRNGQEYDLYKALNDVFSGNSANDPLFGLQAFEVKRASIVVQDEVQKKTWMIPDFSVVFKRDNRALDVDLSYDMEGQLQPTRLRASLSKKASGYQSSLNFQNLDMALLGDTLGFEQVKGRGITLNGSGNSMFSKNWNMVSADFELAAKQGQLKVADLYDRFLDVDHLLLDVSYDVDRSEIDIKKFDVSMHGVALTLQSKIGVTEQKISVPLKITGANIPVDDVEPLWPDVLSGGTEEKWVKERLSEGVITNLNADVPFDFIKQEDGSWDNTFGDVNVEFEFDNLTVDYRAPLKPATEMRGSGAFKDDALRIEGVSGKIEDLVTNKTTVVISDLSVKGGGFADIDVHVEGPFKTLIDYIGDEPIGLADQLGFKADEVKGQASVDIEVDFPTVKDLKIEDVKVKAKADLNDLYLPRIVKGMPLTGGPMTLEAKDGHFNLTGKGQLSQRPIELDYTQYLEMKGAPYAQKVKAKLTADKSLRDTFGIGLEEYVSGDLPLSLTYVEKSNGEAKIDVDVDLTPVEFFIAPLDYTKAPGQAGQASMKIYTVGDSVEEVSDLNITLHDGHIKNGRLLFAKISGEQDVERAQLPDISLPGNALSVDLQQTQDRKTKIQIGAQQLDVRHYLDRGQDIKAVDTPNKKEGVVGRTVISGHVDRLRVSDKGNFNRSKLYVDVDDAGDVHQLELDAYVGKGDVYLRYKPDPFGQLSFRLEANDAGATLKAMDLYDDMVGGILLIEATRPPKSHLNDLDGMAQILNFKVVNAPALARLMNAMSLPGLQQLLNGDGIEFGKMKTDFKRRKKASGTELSFKDGRTSGSEVGLTFEGKINQNTGVVDVKGTVIPLSTFNKVVGQIPIVGQILTGGGALIAATYKMEREKGEEDVKVSVNPLSALTPGILRKILFEGESPAESE